MKALLTIHIFTFTLLICLAHPFGISLAFERSIIQNDDLIILFDEQLRAAARETLIIYPTIRDLVQEKIGWKVSFRPTVVLVADNSTFLRMTDNNLVVAFTVPMRDLMIIDYSRMKTDPFTLSETMKHELCHLLLHKYIPEGHLPRWLDEGVAQWVSGGLPDIQIQKDMALDEAILGGRYLSLTRLTTTFPRENRYLTLAYLESKSIVEYILNEYGYDGLIRLLVNLREKESMDSAVMASFSVSLNELEKRWRNSLEKRATWLNFIVNNLYEILFFFAGLLVIYGFIKIIRKKRNYGDDYDDF